MRVLNLSLDSQVLEKDSAVQRRLLAFAEKIGNTTPALADSGTPFNKGELTVFVPAGRSTVESLSPNLTVQGFGGPKLFQFFRMWSRAVEEVKKNRYDLITVQDSFFLGFLGVQLGEKCKIPVEIQVHGFEKMVGGRKQLARFVLGKATKIRVVSERLKRELNSIFHIPHSKMYVLPVYTQIDTTQRISKRKTVPYPFTFLMVGRLVAVKNIGLQIRAIAELIKQIPHVRLVIVGDGPEKASLKLQVNSLKLEDKILFEGRQENVSTYYGEADAFLLTSDYEGWGRVVLEAAANKLPSIMTDVGLAQEVIKNNENGFVISVGDQSELVLAMKELIDKPELRERLGEAALRTFRSLPTQEVQIQKQVTEWQTLISRK